MGRDELQKCNSRMTVVWDGMNYKNVTAKGMSLGRDELQECNSRRTVLWDGKNYKNVTAEGLSFGTG